MSDYYVNISNDADATREDNMSVDEKETRRIFLAIVPCGWAKASTPEGAIAGAAKNGVGCSNDYGWFKVWSLEGTQEGLDHCYVTAGGRL